MKKIILLVLILVVGYFIYASATKSKPAMENTETKPEVTVNTAIDASITGEYTVSVEESKVMWEGGKKIIVEHIDNGLISVESGSLVFEEGVLTGGEVSIDMQTIVATKNGSNDDTKNSSLAGHLMSEDFFHSEKYPTSTIVFTSVEKGEKDGEYTITGDLTIKETTLPVTFPATIGTEGGMVVGTATLTLDRSKWDVRYGSDSFFDDLGDNVIKNEFKLDITLVAKK